MELDYFVEMLTWNNLRSVADVLLVAYIVYKVLLFVKGTRAAPMLGGLAILLALYWMSSKLGLVSLNWILGNFLGSVILVVVVLFQDDLRRGLVKVGLVPGFGMEQSQQYENTVRAITKSAGELSSKRIGALIAIEQNVGLKEFTEHAVPLDSYVSSQMLYSIFNPTSPLHDGAVVIEGDRISVAGAVLPLTFNPRISSSFGTRHRAAIGLSEKSDALIIVVSEETGVISFIHDGKITRDLDEKMLQSALLSRVNKNRMKKRGKAKKAVVENSLDDADDVEVGV